MSSYLYIDGSYIHSIDELLYAIKEANNHINSSIYDSVVDAICDGTLSEWVSNTADIEDNIKNKICKICQNVQEPSDSITKDDGLRQIVNILDKKSYTHRNVNDYVKFSVKSVTSSVDSVIKLEGDPLNFVYKRSDAKVSLTLVFTCDILKSLDHIFSISIRFVDKQTKERISIDNIAKFRINTWDSLYNKQKESELVFNILADLPKGSYDIELFEEENDSSYILSTSMEVCYYEPKEVIKIKNVSLSGDNIFPHRIQEKTYMAIEHDAKTLNVKIDCIVEKYISSYEFEVKLSNHVGISSSAKCAVVSECSVNIDISDLKTGIYYLSIKIKNTVFGDDIAVYVTGGKREITIWNDVKARFIEIVDRDFHYMVGDKQITNKIYEKIMGKNPFIDIFKNKENISEMPCLFYKTKDYVTYNGHICSLVRKINKHLKNKLCIENESKCIECHPIKLDEWKHCLNNGNIEYEDDLSEISWYAANSNSHLHNVGTKRSTLLGLYDICGNWYTYTDSTKLKWKGLCHYIVGGCCKSTLDDLIRDDILYVHDDSSISVALRLVIDLPKIEDKRHNRIDDDCSSYTEPYEPPYAYWQ